MRQPGDWMALPADDRILEALEDTGFILSGAVLAKNLGYSNNYIRNRLRALSNRGLIDKVEDGYYKINKQGRAYLAGDLDADKLEDS